MTPTERPPLFVRVRFPRRRLVAPLVRFAAGRNLLDVPNTRSSHETSTPRLGGVAVILGTWLGAFVSGFEESWPILLADDFMEGRVRSAESR